MEEMPVVSVATMRESDARTIAKLGSGLELMYRAGRALYLAVPQELWAGTVSIAAGTGNNGGDGFALAGILADKGITATVYQMGSRVSPDSAHFRALARAKGVEMRTVVGKDVPVVDDTANWASISLSELEQVLLDSDVIVDCLLGTGFHGALEGLLREVVLAINDSTAYVVSADINSGLNGDTGIAPLAVGSDLTVSIGFIKNGMLRADAPLYISRLVNADIGIELVRKENCILAFEDYDTALVQARDEGVVTEHEASASVEYFTCDGVTTYRQPKWVSLVSLVI